MVLLLRASERPLLTQALTATRHPSGWLNCSSQFFCTASTQTLISFLGIGSKTAINNAVRHSNRKSFAGLRFAFTLRLGTLTWAKPGITRETTEPIVWR